MEELQQVARQVGASLIERGQTITAAESLTGGLFQATLTAVPGISDVFPGGFVTYSNEAKSALLGIPAPVINQFGVVSEEVAVWMARQARKIMRTDIAVSFTGVAGPAELEGNPAGTAWIGIVSEQGKVTQKYRFDGDRDSVRQQCVLTALQQVFTELGKH
ncbi:CinA family protein [Ligilactobacillus sp. LYQ60]|uniref:CinA family protein n=1 Tax=unclassified Ligilactobacillus TaxID=2767920 RepID=UPI003851BF95